MACVLGDFTDKVHVEEQEQLTKKINMQNSTPAPVPKWYKNILVHPEKEAWLREIQEELANLFHNEIFTIELVP